jgi:hypothetical protein
MTLSDIPHDTRKFGNEIYDYLTTFLTKSVAYKCAERLKLENNLLIKITYQKYYGYTLWSHKKPHRK